MRFICFFLFFTGAIHCQEIFQGKIVSDKGPLSNILIVNQTQKTTCSSSINGFFELQAAINDDIVVSSTLINPLAFKLTKERLQQKPFTIQVQLKALVLEEIVVRNISTKSLGIIPKNIKEYTPAERRLKTATTGGPVGLIYNLVTGNTKGLKKGIEYEKHELNAQKLVNLCGEDFFTVSLKFSKQEVGGFLVFASENPEVAKLLQQKNLALLKFKLTDLSFVFKTRIKS